MASESTARVEPGFGIRHLTVIPANFAPDTEGSGDEPDEPRR